MSEIILVLPSVNNFHHYCRFETTMFTILTTSYIGVIVGPQCQAFQRHFQRRCIIYNYGMEKRKIQVVIIIHGHGRPARGE